jgi:hypothetical protein
MSHYHAVVWLDHHEAKVFHITETEAEKITVKGLSGAQEWLITGPGEAKHELMRHIERHDPQHRGRVVGVESADHPSDGQVCAHARRVFAKVDRTLPQR